MRVCDFVIIGPTDARMAIGTDQLTAGVAGGAERKYRLFQVAGERADSTGESLSRSSRNEMICSPTADFAVTEGIALTSSSGCLFFSLELMQ
jgi:hypothetical protein